MKTYSILAFLFIILASCNRNNNDKNESHSETGQVVGIIDGDTYDILLNDHKTVRIRMEGIDAPERGMPFYKKSKMYLSELCFGKTVRLEIRDIDKYGRKVAFGYLEDGLELSHEMIKSGFAWHFKKYNSDEDLANLESQAKKAKIGIWSIENLMPPWINRTLHQNGISTKDSFNIESHNN
jgi:endonuclease YncB( thermonuclease family)